MSGAAARVSVCTAGRPGAIAIVQLAGSASAGTVAWLTGVEGWDRPEQQGRLRLVQFGEIDEGLAVVDGNWAQLMPHGGPRVVQRLVDRLVELGAALDGEPDAVATYPEADSPIEAEVLAAISRAASPAAIDHLAAQPAAWRERWRDPSALASVSPRLDRLLTPATVVVVGPPNVGKSTLANRVLGRSVSVVADQPGTTRDWTSSLAEIGGDRGGVAVHWLDTPGLRQTDDAVERSAIELARAAIASADVLIAMRDPDTDWPAELPRAPDLRVINKADRGEPDTAPAGVLAISAETGLGIPALESAILSALGLDGLPTPGGELWAFTPTLQRFLRSGGDLSDYLG